MNLLPLESCWLTVSIPEGEVVEVTTADRADEKGQKSKRKQQRKRATH